MDQRTLLAIILSLFLVVAYQSVMEIYFPPDETAISATPVEQKPSASGQETLPEKQSSPAAGTSVPVMESQPVLPEAMPGQQDNANEPFAPFKTDLVEGKISLKGASFSDLRFLKHLTHLPPEGQPIQFFNRHGRDFFFNESGFLGAQIQTPDRNTVWNLAKPDASAPPHSMRLFWDNGQGLLFEKLISIDEKTYLFTVEDRIVNTTDNPVGVHHFSHFIRVEPVIDSNAMAVADFQGPMGFLDGARIQHSYEDVRKKDLHESAVTGWAGFSDKYFLAAFITTDASKKRFYFDFDNPSFRVGNVSEKQTIAPKSQFSRTLLLYIGPKEINTLERVGHDLERSIDYGWFHFLAVPLVELLLIFNAFLHNFGLAIIMLTVMIKAIFFPLANKSYRSMNEMKKLQPKVEELRKRFSDDKARMNQEMMKLYQDNKVNPLGGCLPIVVQIPVFFALYKVLFLSVEMRHAPFFLWIQDLSAQDPFYVLPVLMGISMYLQSRLNPTPADPIQAKIMSFLPVIFTFLFLTFPSGLVLYWLVNNVLSIIQQSYIVKKSS
ncbi:MAG: membrane protein insertase YidC [Magnetococcales bacterium]|nr:membrane protein insertase YidC [Magnetococcales bacterium]MBF0150607.1 membrane protein insertase YidC [Magnetococcales bacterium]MBF0174272.1 membrane protein insertase YidC [Magnetococcales bacterium]